MEMRCHFRSDQGGVRQAELSKVCVCVGLCVGAACSLAFLSLLYKAVTLILPQIGMDASSYSLPCCP